uniref:Chloride channel CLIC-like protein 1 n=1 Tax=Poecilia reticulata TaxID=8081 RepID=A0A3P9NDE0_POERE
MDKMLLLLLLCYLSLSARGQEADDDWLDPYDMLNYDSSTKTMKKLPEMARMSQQPTCNPVFKRFLSRLLKEIQRLGLIYTLYFLSLFSQSHQPTDSSDSLLEGEDRWRTGALDNALSQILVDFKQHDYEAWKWRFEDSFGVELDTVLKVLILFCMYSIF